ncbi:hypothetical protein AMTRI_Chr09g41950 [Amborella trichopoda]|uniref:pentatricopeptide repeat-containing protein At3g53170 n=1 Tax=Amborella trichopoda TaxID=13333 RepID=UPI0005D44096|nr:pentatricopeptide repeat-containing protein At3g53170 [Amborella trichopoda]XP_020527502.1 pentatricopeptide repeat-containing protein At3g53170 [Amborella trichopoda]XP_020527503.1 pentatricopeptide repeat-containing protein At3g53170 [Amborella trichopoda]XP_020527504.1 pentatricopeptide repeat-containing protein At3g53170 [Amborella trichopoda]XP_020527505.1 pentatricopeptide repeat-containing protein At3g53170 [Amborella trichopoda]XP_020527506.1 pentatricopeptide repeat-containing prot|eukprot:XP_011626106.1 pentatricopeptide repeat-containing protein At3g53170 [Amborella trichopoda]
MEKHWPSNSIELRSSCSVETFGCPVCYFCPNSWKRVGFFTVNSAKNNSEASKGLQNESKNKLSRILWTEAAVKGIERKAGLTNSTSLWPRAVLDALSDKIEKNQWESALEIFQLLRKQHWYHPKSQTYVKLFQMLGKCKQHEQASWLFKTMLAEGLKPTIDVYTSLLGVYGLSGQLDKAFHVIDEMKAISDCKPDIRTYTVLINCCFRLSRFDLINWVYEEMSYYGLELNTVTYNCIINGYGKAGMLNDMEKALTEMLETGTCLPDIYTMNSFMWAYGNYGQIEEMEKWYDEFQHMGIEPDIQSLNILIKSYGGAGMHQKVTSVMDFMTRRYFSPTTVTFNIIIETFGRGGNIEEMERIFRMMKMQGVKPNCITYCSLVNGYSNAGLLKKIPSILRQMDNSGVIPDTPLFNCIINAYGSAGDLEMMEEMFVKMKKKQCKPDNVTFSTMIKSYTSRGMVEAASEVEDKMRHMEQYS